MNKDINLLESFEWLGEFWLAEAEDHSFPGVLSYSASGGLLLKVMRRDDFLSGDTDSVRTIYGITFETGPITLLSALAKGDGATRVSENPVRAQEFFIDSALLGEHLDSKTKFRSCQFELNNLAEFFHRQGFKLQDSYSSDPLLSGGHECLRASSHEGVTGFNVSVRKGSTGVYLPRISDTLILDEIKDRELITSLDEAVSKVMKEHLNTSMLAKKEICYGVCVETLGDVGATFSELQSVMRETCGLFGLLFQNIVRPMTLSLTAMPQHTSEESSQTFHSIVSLHLTPRQIERVEMAKDQSLLPVTADALKENYPAVMKSWFDFVGSDFNIIYPTLATHIEDVTSSLQHYILLIASIDQCCVFEKRGGRNDRYQWFVETYATDGLRKLFLKHLPSGSSIEEIGMHLGEIRNCIVHPVRLGTSAFGKYREILKSHQLLNLSEVIYTILILYVYRAIGLSASAINDIERKLERLIPTYRNI